MQIGLIAGGGQFPLLFAKRARQKGYKVVAVGFNAETDSSLSQHVAIYITLYLGQLNKLIKFFKLQGVSRAVMAGTIKKSNIFKDIRPDFKAMKFIAKMAITHDNSILSSFADLLADEGIEIISSIQLIPELISSKGCWTRRKPSRAEQRDISQGWRLAKAVGRLDIGQSILISNGTVLAVEAIDGTDATIRRGGGLACGNDAVVIKICKPNQDERFDLPSTGLTTIETMVEVGAKVLVVEAGKSLVFDKKEMIELADEHGISIIGLQDDNIS